jgi:phosphatidylglycerol:prolipoprotein diacylglycerol transferase
MPHLAYSAFMLLALVVFLLARRCFPQPNVAPRHQFVLGLAAFIGGAFGAKLPFVLGLTGETSAWLADGKTVTTGLVGAYIAVELAKAALGIRAKTGDALALPLALALAVGRWGCFFNGCCYGTPTTLPWAANFGDGVSRHPTQIYESLFHALLAIILLWCIGRGWFRCQRLKLYLIAYAAFRFLTEFIRPEPRAGFGLTLYQWTALLGGLALAAQWWRDARSLSAGQPRAACL